jgi:hypothetical protein
MPCSGWRYLAGHFFRVRLHSQKRYQEEVEAPQQDYQPEVQTLSPRTEGLRLYDFLRLEALQERQNENTHKPEQHEDYFDQSELDGGKAEQVSHKKPPGF